jgi:toxin HigB-1
LATLSDGKARAERSSCTDLAIRADQLRRIRDVFAHLDEARHPSDLDLPGYGLHPLRGGLRGHWSVSISGNWRIVFRFEGGDAYDVDLVDYH